MKQGGEQREVTEDGEEVIILGIPRKRFGDLYHRFLRASWTEALGSVVLVFLLLNAAFAIVYTCTGGVAGARHGSFFDAYAFSIETMATIGYGDMHPESVLARVLVILEAVIGLLVTAVTTGLVFSKFSQPRSRVAFSEKVAIGPMNGVPTVAFRIGNERGNRILEATIRVVLLRTETTTEGARFYRMYDLALARERSPALARSWTAMHFIDEKSLLRGATPESVAKDEIELLVTVVGTDDTSLQPVHARKRYRDGDMVWGARLADILDVRDDGTLVLDMNKFHGTTATKPTPDFPYP